VAEHLTTTPSGIEIVFEDGLPNPKTGKSKRRAYTVDGAKYPSVTTVLHVIEKPGLQYGAERLTMQAALELLEDGVPLHEFDVDQALEAAGGAEIRFRQVWNRAAELGTEMHELPLSTWLPEAEVLDNEVMVASKHHGFAGRFDYLVRLPEYPGQTIRLDLKTTKKIERYKDGRAKAPYKEHLAQLGGYEIAAAECGYPTADLSGVLRVTHDGEQDLFLTRPRERLFVAALQLYKATREDIPAVTAPV
jgi:hypothetical protein